MITTACFVITIAWVILHHLGNFRKVMTVFTAMWLHLDAQVLGQWPACMLHCLPDGPILHLQYFSLSWWDIV